MSKSLLSKINQMPLLSQVFDFLPKKKALKVTIINKKLSFELNLSIDDYLLEEKYRKIILNSKGSVNDIYLKAFKCYKESDCNTITFPETTQKIIKYMKYLYHKKVFRYYTITSDFLLFYNITCILFLIELLRNMKKGISFEFCGVLNFKYYDILKDAIINLEEIHSTTNYTIHKMSYDKLYSFPFYYDLFDWTKVKCFNLTKIQRGFYKKGNSDKYFLVPDNATFRKIIIDDNSPANCNDLAKFMNKHGKHLEYLKIFNFKDYYVDSSFFSNLIMIKKVKLINCSHFIFFNFLVFFKKYLHLIKNLVLDGIIESELNYLSDQKERFYLIQNVLPRLNNLEKLEINFKNIDNIANIYKLLSSIVSLNPNLKELKICLKFLDKKEKKEEIFLHKFIGKEINLEENNLKEFYILIKEISALKNLSNLELNFELDDKMSQIVSTFLNAGNNLKNLSLTHTKKLNVTHLLNSHPYLININFCLEEKDAEDAKRLFNYEFAQRSWKSITLKNYPLNNSFVDVLMKVKNSLHDLTLENTFNVSEKSSAEVNNILLAIKKYNI